MNTYIQLIKEISFDNKYTKWYINIVEKALKRASSKQEAIVIFGYVESHHIVPESTFKIRKRKGPKGILEGTGNSINNIVHLSFREHYILHMMLIKMIKDKNLRCRLSSALMKMKDLEKYTNSRTYETAKKIYLKNHIMKTEEARQRTSENMTKYYASQEGKETLRIKAEIQKESMIGEGNPMFGKESGFSGGKHTEEHKEKIRNKKGKDHHNFGKHLNKSRYRVTDSEGNIYIIKNIKHFALEMDIKASRLYQSVYKNTVIEGWLCEQIKEPKAILIDPQGKEHEVFNIKQFCKDNDLYYQCIIHVIGKRKPQHKGWTGYKINRD